MKNDELQPIQLMTITATCTMGFNILTFSRDIVLIAGQDGWLSLFLAGGISVLISLILFKFLSFYPGKDLPEIILKIGGPFWGRIMLVPILAYTLVYPSLMVRAFVNALLTFLMDNTPLIVLVLSFFIVVCQTVKRGLSAIAGVIDLLFPFIIVSFVILVLLAIPRAEIKNIQPILFENTLNVFKSIIPAYQTLLGVGIIGYVLSRVSESKGTLKWHLYGFGITFTLFTALYVVMILNFGPGELKTFVYPTISMAKAIDFPVSFLERVESLLGIIWISVVFSAICLYYFAFLRNVAVFFKVKPEKEKHLAYIQMPVFLLIALLPKNNLINDQWMAFFRQLINVISFGFIPFLTGYAVLEKRRGGKE